MGIKLFFCLAAILVGIGGAHAQRVKGPVNIIFDSDMGPDYDDVGAIAILHAMADRGECRILATMASNRHPYIAADLSVLNTYFKRGSIPVGVVAEPAVHLRAWQGWDSLLAVRYPHTIGERHPNAVRERHPDSVGNRDTAMDALALYRKILAAQPDHSVTIVTVGFMTNMANLLRSEADRYSTLNGRELVAKKVRQLVSMAGRFDGKDAHFAEFNVVKDVAASQYAFDKWPGPILFSGFEIGMAIHTGLPLCKTSLTHSPVKDVFQRCIPMDPNDKNGRMSWDETAVLVAVRGAGPYFDVKAGKMICHPDGTNGWDTNETRDQYLVMKMPPEKVAAVIDRLMIAAHGKR